MPAVQAARPMGASGAERSHVSFGAERRQEEEEWSEF
eukprot:gene9147-9284_t